MATITDVLQMLIPNGGYTTHGNEYEGIQFLECEAITKKEFEAGFAKFDNWKAEQDAKHAADKAALLTKIGITAEEAKLLLS